MHMLGGCVKPLVGVARALLRRYGGAMLKKQIRFFGQDVVLACDGRCDKAWGINGRAQVRLGEDADDYVFVPDSALGSAEYPQTWEGLAMEGRPSDEPLADAEQMNRWCARECERSGIFKLDEPVVLRDLENPCPNMPRSASPFERDAAGRVCLTVARDVEIRLRSKRKTVRVEAGVPLAEALAS